MITDPIADLLTRMRNAVKARHQKTMVPHSKMKAAILNVLKKYNFITDFKVVKKEHFNEIEIYFRSDLNVLNLKRISKPGQRIYVKKNEIKSILSDYGIAVISTPQGVMSNKDAQKNGVGGEYICEVW